MREYRLEIDGRDVSGVRVADSYLSRLRGLLGTDETCLPLLLTPANSVHGLGMRYALDVAQLTGELSELHVVRLTELRRGGVVGPRRGVNHVLEAPSGAFATWALRIGSHVAVVKASPS